MPKNTNTANQYIPIQQMHQLSENAKAELRKNPIFKESLYRVSVTLELCQELYKFNFALVTQNLPEKDKKYCELPKTVRELCNKTLMKVIQKTLNVTSNVEVHVTYSHNIDTLCELQDAEQAEIDQFIKQHCPNWQKYSTANILDKYDYIQILISTKIAIAFASQKRSLGNVMEKKMYLSAFYDWLKEHLLQARKFRQKKINIEKKFFQSIATYIPFTANTLPDGYTCYTLNINDSDICDDINPAEPLSGTEYVARIKKYFEKQIAQNISPGEKHLVLQLLYSDVQEIIDQIKIIDNDIAQIINDLKIFSSLKNEINTYLMEFSESNLNRLFHDIGSKFKQISVAVDKRISFVDQENVSDMYQMIFDVVNNLLNECKITRKKHIQKQQHQEFCEPQQREAISVTEQPSTLFALERYNTKLREEEEIKQMRRMQTAQKDTPPLSSASYKKCDDSTSEAGIKFNVTYGAETLQLTIPGENIYSIAGLQNVFIANIFMCPENQDMYHQQFKSIIDKQHSSFLSRVNPKCDAHKSGIKLLANGVIAVKDASVGHRLMCVPYKVGCHVVYLPSKIVTHKEYEAIFNTSSQKSQHKREIHWGNQFEITYPTTNTYEFKLT